MNSLAIVTLTMFCSLLAIIMYYKIDTQDLVIDILARIIFVWMMIVSILKLILWILAANIVLCITKLLVLKARIRNKLFIRRY